MPTLRRRPRRPLLVALLMLASLPVTGAQAAPQVSGVFDLPGVTTNGQLTVGPGGDVWIALDQAVGRVSPAGTVTTYTTGGLGDTTGFLSGGITSAGGFIWVSQPPGALEALVKIPPANPAAAAGVPVTGLTAGTSALTTGPDGNLWLAVTGKILKVPPATPAAATTYPVAGLNPKAIAPSADGTLWVTDTDNGGRLLNVTTAGAITPYTVGGQPQFLAAAPGGRVVFGNPNNAPQQITRLLPGGLQQATDRPSGSDPFGVAYGADGAFWVAEFAGNRLVRMTGDGALTTLGGLPVVAGQGPRQLTAAPGNTLWVTLDKPGDGALAKIARVTGVDPAPAAGGTPGPVVTPAADTTAPVVTLALTRTRFRAGPRSTALTAAARPRRAPAGTTIAVTLSERATVRLAVQRAFIGRRSGGRCLAATRRTRRAAARCTRWVAARTLTRSLAAGRTGVAFSARFGGRALPTGAYRVAATATDGAGLRGVAPPVRFTVVRR